MQRFGAAEIYRIGQGRQDLGRQRSTERLRDEKIQGRNYPQESLGTKRLRNLEIYRRSWGRKDLGTQRSTRRLRDEKIQGMLGFA